jgi:hypothetical protein
MMSSAKAVSLTYSLHRKRTRIRPYRHGYYRVIRTCKLLGRRPSHFSGLNFGAQNYSVPIPATVIKHLVLLTLSTESGVLRNFIRKERESLEFFLNRFTLDEEIHPREFKRHGIRRQCGAIRQDRDRFL